MDRIEHGLITTGGVVQADLISSAFLRTECGPAGDAIDVSNTATLALPVRLNPKNRLDYHIGAQESLRTCNPRGEVR